MALFRKTVRGLDTGHDRWSSTSHMGKVAYRHGGYCVCLAVIDTAQFGRVILDGDE